MNGRSHRLALHVDQNNPDVMRLALNNARNVHELYQKRGEDVAIEIVANSGGLHMLRDDTSPVMEEIRALLKTLPQLALSACNNTKTGMWRSKKASPCRSSRGRPSCPPAWGGWSSWRSRATLT
jgi:uncharacterized protein